MNIGRIPIITIVFIVLKLCHVVAWSWWLVFAPVWFPFAGVLAFYILAWVYILIKLWVMIR